MFYRFYLSRYFKDIHKKYDFVKTAIVLIIIFKNFSGEITIINDADLSLVELPNTPQKQPQESPVEGISTQILPLARLSLSSSNSSPPNNNNNINNKQEQTTPTGRPVAEVPPFSSAENVEKPVEIRSKNSPVRDKLDKIRRSLTEPLIQYFHDLQSTPDEEESEVLNTPKSVIPPAITNVEFTNNKPKSRSLFNENSAKDSDSNCSNSKPQMMVTDM